VNVYVCFKNAEEVGNIWPRVLQKSINHALLHHFIAKAIQLYPSYSTLRKSFFIPSYLALVPSSIATAFTHTSLYLNSSHSHPHFHYRLAQCEAIYLILTFRRRKEYIELESFNALSSTYINILTSLKTHTFTYRPFDFTAKMLYDSPSKPRNLVSWGVSM
jgi:hypothetical protein